MLGLDWMYSPRTGYTYVDTPAYSPSLAGRWDDSSRVNPPHMARNPLGHFEAAQGRPLTTDYRYSTKSFWLASLLSALSACLRMALYEFPATVMLADTWVLQKGDSPPPPLSRRPRHPPWSDWTLRSATFLYGLTSSSLTFFCNKTGQLLNFCWTCFRRSWVGEKAESFTEVVEYVLIRHFIYREVVRDPPERPFALEEEKSLPVTPSTFSERLSAGGHLVFGAALAGARLFLQLLWRAVSWVGSAIRAGLGWGLDKAHSFTELAHRGAKRIALAMSPKFTSSRRKPKYSETENQDVDEEIDYVLVKTFKLAEIFNDAPRTGVTPPPVRLSVLSERLLAGCSFACGAVLGGLQTSLWRGLAWSRAGLSWVSSALSWFSGKLHSLTEVSLRGARTVALAMSPNFAPPAESQNFSSTRPKRPKAVRTAREDDDVDEVIDHVLVKTFKSTEISNDPSPPAAEVSPLPTEEKPERTRWLLVLLLLLLLLGFLFPLVTDPEAVRDALGTATTAVESLGSVTATYLNRFSRNLAEASSAAAWRTWQVLWDGACLTALSWSSALSWMRELLLWAVDAALGALVDGSELVSGVASSAGELAAGSCAVALEWICSGFAYATEMSWSGLDSASAFLGWIASKFGDAVAKGLEDLGQVASSSAQGLEYVASSVFRSAADLGTSVADVLWKFFHLSLASLATFADSTGQLVTGGFDWVWNAVSGGAGSALRSTGDWVFSAAGAFLALISQGSGAAKEFLGESAGEVASLIFNGATACGTLFLHLWDELATLARDGFDLALETGTELVETGGEVVGAVTDLGINAGGQLLLLPMGIISLVGQVFNSTRSSVVDVEEGAPSWTWSPSRLLSTDAFREMVRKNVEEDLAQLREEIDAKIQSLEESLKKRPNSYKERQFGGDDLIAGLDKLLPSSSTVLDEEEKESWKASWPDEQEASRPVPTSPLEPLLRGMDELRKSLVDLDVSTRCCNKDGSMTTTEEVLRAVNDVFLARIPDLASFMDLGANRSIIEERIRRSVQADRKGLAADMGTTFSSALRDSLARELTPRLAHLFANFSSAPASVDPAEWSSLLEEALLRYDSDKTGRFDFALESAGGSVVSIRCTEMYRRLESAVTLLGIPLWYPTNNPRTAIRPGALPGECWPFRGARGHLVVQLSRPVRPTAFSMEHISKSQSPDGRIDSAPREFAVHGLREEMDPEPRLLGRFEYDDDGDPVQYFAVQDDVGRRFFSHVELEILSNHGHVNYTCLYRFRVHGNPS